MDEQERFNTQNGEGNAENYPPQADDAATGYKPQNENNGYADSYYSEEKNGSNANRGSFSDFDIQQERYQSYYSSLNNNNGGYDASSEPSYSPYSAQNGYEYTTRKADEFANKTETEEKKKSSKTGKAIFLSVIAVILAALIGLGVWQWPKLKEIINKQSAETAQGDAQLLISEDSVASVDDSDGLSSEEIYSMNYKSNVGIILYGSQSALFSMNGSNSSSSSIVGEGSGIVMGTNDDKTKTYIITCAHVIEGAKTNDYDVVVQDYTGKEYDAQVVGYDSKTDIGVISVASVDFTVPKFGKSSALKIGETVYAIGNPGGTEFFGSYTKGMVSAIERPVSNEIGYDMKCIQHDAAINPGNSGGMLINSSGYIIGINSSKIASTEYEGMGFSIPIESAQTIINDIIANGYVTNRPKLGISYAQVSQYPQYQMIAHYNDLPSGSLIIVEISKDSGFSGTKAEEGDLIIAVDGEELETADVLLEKIENGKVGDKLKLTLCRIDSKTYDVEKFDVEVTLVEDKGTTESTTESQSQSYDDSLEDFFNYGY